jgi:L-cysteine S-thiosulfotransferase
VNPAARRATSPARAVALLAAAAFGAGSDVATAQTFADGDLRARYQVVGDGIPVPLTVTPGDAQRGRRIVVDRQVGLCTLCHSGPFAEVRQQGDLSTHLGGAGSRWSTAQLRLRLVDPQRLNPDSIMPAYFRNHGLRQVGSAFAGRPVLEAQQIEDVVAFLVTLQ